ncbi:hypothetical protein HYPSUDRAFT_204595 [Hypholoma sublateritium FD-334 SS-4]|uniref:Uncharacterized protein n=1 Tax=Hypholoma sublateritium (strain FD-334 SS-4) TaxID=945553 RepID=A0A0D2NRP8_HYPSF|nr:hypothetical protein HYPSUDRAFT_204595 [Hypholoma sublateritium FD-334 SS-4]
MQPQILGLSYACCIGLPLHSGAFVCPPSEVARASRAPPGGALVRMRLPAVIHPAQNCKQQPTLLSMIYPTAICRQLAVMHAAPTPASTRACMRPPPPSGPLHSVTSDAGRCCHSSLLHRHTSHPPLLAAPRRSPPRPPHSPPRIVLPPLLTSHPGSHPFARVPPPTHQATHAFRDLLPRVDGAQQKRENLTSLPSRAPQHADDAPARVPRTPPLPPLRHFPSLDRRRPRRLVSVASASLNDAHRVDPLPTGPPAVGLPSFLAHVYRCVESGTPGAPCRHPSSLEPRSTPAGAVTRAIIRRLERAHGRTARSVIPHWGLRVRRGGARGDVVPSPVYTGLFWMRADGDFAVDVAGRKHDVTRDSALTVYSAEYRMIGCTAPVRAP